MDTKPTLLTERQVLDILAERGIPISVATLRRWRALRRPPNYFKFGKQVRYGEESIESFVKRCEVSAIEPRDVA
jgi:hypothetical protein